MQPGRWNKLNKRSLFIFFLIAACCVSTSGAVEMQVKVSDEARKKGRIAPGEIIIEAGRGIVDLGKERGVVPREKVSIKSDSINKLNEKYGLVSIERLFSGTRKDEPSDIYVFRFSKDANIDNIVSAYGEDENVIYAEPNYTVRAE